VKFVVNLIYYRYTVARDNPLPGHEIQNLQYASRTATGDFTVLTKQQKILLFVLDIFGRYLVEKIQYYFENKDDESLSKTMKTLKRLFTWLEKIYKLFDFINFLLFIKSLRYHTPIERLLQIVYKSIKQGVKRYLDFEYMNRTIIWNILSDFMGFAIPYVQYGLGEVLRKIFFFTTFIGSISMDIQEPENSCGICKDEKVTLPYHTTKCKCNFCYFCIKNYHQKQMALKKQMENPCPKCGTPFSEIEQAAGS